MRTNIDIDDATLEAAMRAGPYKTKKEAVEAGLKLLARQAVYQEILSLRGKLRWEDAPSVGMLVAREAEPPPYRDAAAPARPAAKAKAKAAPAAPASARRGKKK